MRPLTLLATSLLILTATAHAHAGGQECDRALTATDITFEPAWGGGGGGGEEAGWVVTIAAQLTSSTNTPLNMGSTITLWLNGVLVDSFPQPATVPPFGAQPISADFLVAALAPGDVISASVSAAPGAVPEIYTANDAAFRVVPTPGGYNRLAKPTAIHYGRTSSGEYALAGEVTWQSDWDGIDRNLSTDVLVLVNGTPFGGGGGGGGGCNSTALIIYMGSGGMLSGSNPPLFDCAMWCAICQHTNGNPNGNICVPPNISGSPFCFCDENCTTARIVPGRGWQVNVPQLTPADQVTVILSPHPGSLPETNTADDTAAARAADIPVCPAVFADLGKQGGLPGGDGLYDNNDFIVFINDFFNADPHADLGAQGGAFGPDGLYNNNDFVVFISLFFTGC